MTTDQMAEKAAEQIMAGRAWITPQQFSDSLGIGLKKAHALIEAGVLPAANVRSTESTRSSYRILKPHVEAYLIHAQSDRENRPGKPRPKKRVPRQSGGRFAKLPK